MKKILIIEDNADVRENAGEILQLAGYEVVEAANGKEGVDQCRKAKPDLIICDIMMPELDGYGVLHILSKDPDTASIPFIFLSAKAERDDLRKGMTLGADDYLTKPFDDSELLNAIESRFRRQNDFFKAFTRDTKGLEEFMKEARTLKELNQVSERCEKRLFHKKENIYQEGSASRYLYFVNSGIARTYMVNSDGKEFVTGVYKTGDFFGYMHLIEGGDHNDNAVAMEDTELSLIPAKDFHDLMQQNQMVSEKFIKMISNDLKEMEQHLLNLAYNSVRKRVADTLVMLANRYQTDATSVVKMAVSRDDLASMVGTAKESVIRVLSDFKEEGLLETRASEITILNLEKLKKTRN
jgi:CRP/FNR family transcriptional regulator, polysaccharide utilization system transcription regulator